MAKHVALVINGSDAEKARIRSEMPDAEVMPLCTPQLDDEGIRLLGTHKKVIMVRPDGYVGFRGSMAQEEERHSYARMVGLMPEAVRLAA
jgi:hypothetical protein